LVHTSNKGSQDIQEIIVNQDIKCYEHLANIIKPIIEKNNGQSGLSSIGIVSGATYKEQAISLRKTLPSAPFLIPGYGAQGASASEACAPLIKDQSYSGLKNFGLINASRSVLFPKNSYLVNSIEEWENIILTNLKKTNDILINTQI
jgi:orotidine-5'-phosphate decarboxylase